MFFFHDEMQYFIFDDEMQYFVPFSVGSSLTNSTLSFPYRNRNEMVNFGPAAGVVGTRLALRPILERTPYSYTLDPLLHSAVIL